MFGQLGRLITNAKYSNEFEKVEFPIDAKIKKIWTGSDFFFALSEGKIYFYLMKILIFIHGVGMNILI